MCLQDALLSVDDMVKGLVKGLVRSDHQSSHSQSGVGCLPVGRNVSDTGVWATAVA